jgi:lipoprotein NlpD
MKSAPAMGAAAPGRSAEAAAAAAGAATGGQAAAAGAAPARAPDAEWSWPTNGKVVQGFAESTKGIALGGTSGDPVLAAAEGKVIFSGNGPRGYGNLVIVKHNNTYLSAYAHNQNILVKEGQSVSKGQKIAEMGNTDADQVKLHFEVRRQGKPVDPLKYLPPR